MKVKNNLVSTKQGLEVNKVLFLFHRQKKAGNEIIQNLFMCVILFRPSGAVTTIGKRSTNCCPTGHAAVVGTSFVIHNPVSRILSLVLLSYRSRGVMKVVIFQQQPCLLRYFDLLAFSFR